MAGSVQRVQQESISSSLATSPAPSALQVQFRQQEAETDKIVPATPGLLVLMEMHAHLVQQDTTKISSETQLACPAQLVSTYHKLDHHHAVNAYYTQALRLGASLGPNVSVIKATVDLMVGLARRVLLESTKAIKGMRIACSVHLTQLHGQAVQMRQIVYVVLVSPNRKKCVVNVKLVSTRQPVAIIYAKIVRPESSRTRQDLVSARYAQPAPSASRESIHLPRADASQVTVAPPGNLRAYHVFQELSTVQRMACATHAIKAFARLGNIGSPVSSTHEFGMRSAETAVLVKMPSLPLMGTIQTAVAGSAAADFCRTVGQKSARGAALANSTSECSILSHLFGALTACLVRSIRKSAMDLKLWFARRHTT